MSEILHSRDCVVLFRGDAQTVALSAEMIQGGWAGGQGVQWAPGGAGERTVTYSTGLYGGFLVWGSDEPGDRFTSMVGNQTTHRFATMLYGGNLISTSTYERYTYASRTGGGPLVPLHYVAQQVLYLSRRGLWTNEDEMTLAGALEAPAFFTGFVAKAPIAANQFFLGIQTSM